MTGLIVALTVLVSISGIAVAIWSLLSTRKKYFQEYMERKRND